MQSPDGADFALDPPALAGLVVRDLGVGKDVVLLVEPTYGVSMLDHTAMRLSGGRNRVIRVTAAVAGGLDLPGFLRQLGDCTRSVHLRNSDPTPEQDIAVLTTLDATCDRIVLLVDHAESLGHDALLAIQLACRASIRLRLVFAGLPGLLSMLDHPELSTLEGRLLRGVRYTTVAEEPDGRGEAPLVRRGVARPAFAAAACAVLALSGVLTYRSWTQDNIAGPELPERPAPPAALTTASREQVAAPLPEANAGSALDVAPEPQVSPAPTPISPVENRAKPVGGSAHSETTLSAQHLPKRGLPTREASLSRTGESRGSEARFGEFRAGGYRAASEYRQPPPRALAEGDTATEYIGTFSTGPGGVRSFHYRP